MSRAFVKEDEGGKWEGPVARAPFRVLCAGAGAPDTLREGDDLLGLLRWAATRPQGPLELRREDGTLLATVSA